MPAPSADSFAALARSSPWRWSTLRFTVTWPGDRWTTGAVRAWLRRPDALRVESVDGGLLRAERTPAPTIGILGPGGGTTRTAAWASQTDPPALRPDGFVAERPDDPFVTYDDPMHDSYHWVAMLDPAELADGVDRQTGERTPALRVESVEAVEHAGRAAWEAVVVPEDTYEPRCGCCPLLRTRAVDLVEFEDHPEHLLEVYPDAFRVRLDVQTGVCVLTEEIGGLSPGKGHDLRIEAVNEPMDDALFVRRRREERGGLADWLEKRGARRAERARRRR
ncbi:hypothetical protein SAMN05660662_2058 [Blastococcus aurantiacus]|uniref:Uncharacterized protein n=1 Tax=Blastococcus aurantiacus TaxID=1550231 RepID=A0A1G7KT04_9ACTN|nr:hypothetical protein [Blastococcus aurantiacus]SDF40388.1 hypothetical protein SAMN05660662_2058 [Blastococcus aurantiacus]